MKKNKWWQISLIIILLASILVFIYLDHTFHFFNQEIYSASDFGFKDMISDRDEDNDGINDSLDIVLSARKYIETKPIYQSKYYDEGYPDDEYGVCTDVVWQALKGAGYSLKDMIDVDIAKNQSLYENVETIDSNIDFRRVLNLKVFFDRTIQSVSLDKEKMEKWQPGDIVLTATHIMILSDKRNQEGLPFIIHHDNFGARERNEIDNYKFIGHYRFIPNS